MDSKSKKRKISYFETAILGLTLASVIVAIWMYLPEVEFTKVELSWIYVFDFIVVGILSVDFGRRAARSEVGAKKYIFTHCYELPAMLPLIMFFAIEDQFLVGAAVRSLRLLRLIRLLRLANLFRSLNGLKQNGFIYFAIIFTATIIFGSIAIYAVEAGHDGSTIRTYEDAAWFAITSATISGYGDVYPTTSEGRIIASVLIFVGLAMILGFFASVGSTLMAARDKKKANDPKLVIRKQIDEELEHLSVTDLDALNEMIKDLQNKATSTK